MGDIVHTEDYERDNVKYVITVEKEGALWGKWHCPNCDEQGGSSKSCATIEEAVLAAITNTTMHHGIYHLKKD